ncbi:hypothetical protein [Aestuariivivens insulae]|uniref:hypothetical protein n=1 Tax=Aestuariivivens insulae TaxID=1621988 RepID=UPI001F59CE3E|nr:hypothetical protein [Aestuariivivens insulae]
MKKLLLIALAIVSLQAVAQEPKKEGPRYRDNMANMPAEDMAELQTKKMTLHLDLNEKQQKEIYAINLENAKARKEHMKARKAKREAGEKPSQEERTKMMKAMLDHKIAMMQKMKIILNEEQFAKWEKAQAKMDHKRKEGMKHKAHKKGDKMKKEQ